MTVLRTTMTMGVALVLVVASGCTRGPDEDAAPTIRQTAEDLIRGDVAAQAGLGDLTPTCPEVGAVAVGTAWQCTALTEDQRVVTIDAVIGQSGQIELATTNMIAAPALPSFERAAVQALNNTVGSRLTDESIDCGDAPVVFPQEQRLMVCALFDPDTRQTYDITLTITDIEARQFTLVVADQPRP
jgi:hypothetical protein